MNFMYKNTLYLIFLISLISCSSSGEDINYPESKKLVLKKIFMDMKLLMTIDGWKILQAMNQLIG